MERSRMSNISSDNDICEGINRYFNLLKLIRKRQMKVFDWLKLGMAKLRKVALISLNEELYSFKRRKIFYGRAFESR